MKTDNALTGVNFTRLDTPVIKYVDYLSTRIPLSTVNNFFVFTARGSFNALKRNKGKEEGELMLHSIKENMDKKITPKYKNIKNVKNHVVADIFVQGVYHLFDHTNTDLVVMGKENGSHGTTNKLVVRHVPSQTLIIPEKSKHRLKKIVIALDQSELSKKLLHKALDFCSLISGSPSITCLHVGYMPAFSELTGMYDDTYPLEMYDYNLMYDDYEKAMKSAFENFVKENTKNYKGPELKVEYVTETRKPYHGLMDYIDEGKADLVIFGTKSHTFLDTILLGSFAEKMISKNDKVPMLVIK